MTPPPPSGAPTPSLGADLRALLASPRELWLIYAIKLLESIAYFTVYTLLVIFLSDQHRFSDEAAGSVAGTWLTAISLVVFGAGFVADGIGIRKAMLIAAISTALGRILLALSGGTIEAVYLGLLVSVWGIASLKPTMNAAVRAYSTPATVSFAFSLYYVVMNLGAVTQGPLVDGFRAWFVAPVSLLGHPFSASQLVFLVGAVFSCVNIGLVLLMREEARPVGETVRRSPLSIAREVTKERAFWWFFLFVVLLTMVRLIFQHAHLTWPKYALRTFGDDFPFATYWSINPAMVILLTPAVTALTRKLPTYQVIVSGAMISSLSVFAMAFSSSVTASVVFIVTLSLGETLWSPRLYEYTATVAPKGREASYMGLSEVPLFLAKPIAGWMSGWFLANWVPVNGPRDPQAMWAIIGAMTIASPIVMLLSRRWLDRGPGRVPEGTP